MFLFLSNLSTHIELNKREAKNWASLWCVCAAWRYGSCFIFCLWCCWCFQTQWCPQLRACLLKFLLFSWPAASGFIPHLMLLKQETPPLQKKKTTVKAVKTTHISIPRSSISARAYWTVVVLGRSLCFPLQATQHKLSETGLSWETGSRFKYNPVKHILPEY